MARVCKAIKLNAVKSDLKVMQRTITASSVSTEMFIYGVKDIYRCSFRSLLFLKVTKKERPPMQEYVRKLLYKDLSKTTTEKVYPGHYIKITFLKGK